MIQSVIRMNRCWLLRLTGPLLLVLMLWVILLATSRSPAGASEATPVWRYRGDLAIAARYVLRKYCHDCHGGQQRQGRFLALDYQQMVRSDRLVRWVKPGSPAESQLLQFVEEGSMPPGNHSRPAPAEIQWLREWIAAGAPSFPARFDEKYIGEVLERDVSQRGPEASDGRYVSLTHRITDDKPLPSILRELRQYCVVLQQGLYRCGVRRIEPVDPSGTILRFDIRSVAWDNRQVFLRLHQGSPVGIYPLSPYDLLLLEYPVATGNDLQQGWPPSVQEYLRKSRLARPVPYLRGDWLAALLFDSPLADELRSLTTLAQSLQRQHWPDPGCEKELPCGPPVRPFRTLVLPSATNKTDCSPPTAWYLPAHLTHSKQSTSLSASLITPQGQQLSQVRTGEPFLLQVQTSHDVHFVLLMVWCNGHIEIQETNRGGYLRAGVHRLAPRQAEAFRIVDILTGEQQTQEFFVLLTARRPLPSIVLVRSRHASLPTCEVRRCYPIERFLFEPEKTGEPATPPDSIDRLIIPIPLSSKS